MVEQPVGTETLLLSDIEGSTRLLSELGLEAYRDLLGRHRQLLRAAFRRHGGYKVDNAREAVRPAVEAQVALERGPLRVRIGLQTGEPDLDPPKYVGLDVHRAARIMSAAHGDQLWAVRTRHGWVTAVSFSPDARTVAATREDDVVALYDAARGRPARTLHACQVAGRNLTLEEWSQFVAGRSFTKVCPR
jgi:WD40 repeat protein